MYTQHLKVLNVHCNVMCKDIDLYVCCYRDVDQVHDMMDEIAEQQEVANEIGEAISNPVGFGQDLDEVNIDTFIITFWFLD